MFCHKGGAILATIWVIEGSQTVQKMVEISLAGLPVKLTCANQVADLIQSGSPKPDLVITAEHLPKNQSPSHGYQAQAWQLAHVGYRCPLIVLTRYASSGLSATSLEEGIILAGSLRKPFKTQDLIELVCKALKLPVPDSEVFKKSPREIPLARKSVVTPAPAAQSLERTVLPEESSVHQVTTPTPTSVGSLFSSMTPVQSARATQPAPISAPLEEEVNPAPPPLPPAEREEASGTSDQVEVNTPPSDLSVASEQDTELSIAPIVQSSEEDVATPSTSSSLSNPRIEEHLDDWMRHPSKEDQSEAIVAVSPAPQQERLVPQPSVNAHLLELVHEATSSALQIVNRVNARNASPLTPDEMRILVERVAWEMIPSIVSDLLSSSINTPTKQNSDNDVRRG